MPRVKSKPFQLSVILRSKVFLLVCFVLVAFFSVSVVKELIRKSEINHEIENLQNQIAYLEDTNQELGDLIDYINSSTFQEKEVKSRLNLRAEGEKVVLIPENSQPGNLTSEIKSSGESVTNENNLSNPQLWWNYFFTK
ncbi:MAG: septum formation initiator family protein [Patescibacteria group bacterium]